MIIKDKEYIRSILFGLEDSLISTTGLIAGISIGSNGGKVVLLAGTVAVFVEAISMGVGEYLSDDAVSDLDKMKHHKDSPELSGLLLTVAYLLAGAIPLLAVLLLPYPHSLIASIALALFCLFLLGYVKGRMVHTTAIKSGLKILIIGGITMVIGIIVGVLFKM